MSEHHLQLSDRALELVAHRFKLLGEPTRLRLLRQLMQGEQSVNELVSASGSTQANVSKHLNMLAEGGLLARRKVGLSTLYSIADPTLFTLCDLVCRSLQTQGAEELQHLRTEKQSA